MLCKWKEKNVTRGSAPGACSHQVALGSLELTDIHLFSASQMLKWKVGVTKASPIPRSFKGSSHQSVQTKHWLRVISVGYLNHCSGVLIFVSTVNITVKLMGSHSHPSLWPSESYGQITSSGSWEMNFKNFPGFSRRRMEYKVAVRVWVFWGHRGNRRGVAGDPHMVVLAPLVLSIWPSPSRGRMRVLWIASIFHKATFTLIQK